jgi:23S rRNA (uracil1939-C5)-methyltransferase
MATVEVRAERMVAGGLALAREAGGRVVLVDGAIPGERVLVETTPRRGATMGAVVEVLEASPDRVEPPCPHVARGCGGCDWQHVTPARQRELRREIVTDALSRLGGVTDPAVRLGPEVPAERSRDVLRLGVVEGVLGLRRREGHELVPVDDCLVAVPALAELLAPGAVELGGASEVTLRVGHGTGERQVIAVGAAEASPIHAVVAGHRLRVSPRSFFQTRGAGAEALVEVARGQVAGAPDGTFVDLYGGVGLFAVTLAGDRRVVLVERSTSSAADARHNLDGRDAQVVARPVERWRPCPAAVVVADPARAGLGAAGVAKVDATGTGRLVLVSCDAASLGRDTALLRKAGFGHVESVSVDMFGHTGHVEVVTRFDR